MRWDSLFDDLEGQLEQELTAEGDELRAEEERLRIGRLALRDRICALLAARPLDPLRLRLVTGEQLSVRALTVGRDWLSGETGEGGRSGVIVPLTAVAALVLRPDVVALSLEPGQGVERALPARLGLPFVLRDLARRRVPVSIQLAAGSVEGTIDRVGRDTLDLAVHDLDLPRRSNAVRAVEVLALPAVLAVRLRG
ncbi:hypothetical protein [Naasia sp. SYSU D00948]|uniref:hypothetical protein n=1 Tax=Naasia sp. SYSU D00948 TaxID=2817379 RepID=UPI001B30C93D|nr:hypothetical protein [Naasia sp. SYSU D00948]